MSKPRVRYDWTLSQWAGLYCGALFGGCVHTLDFINWTHLSSIEMRD